MKNLINPKYKHLLWKDENNDPFYLTNFCEIYEFSDTELGIILYKNPPSRLKNDMFSDFHKLSDRITTCKTKAENLEKILISCKWKKRIHINGKLLKNLEIRLGHKILPYRPKI